MAVERVPLAEKRARSPAGPISASRPAPLLKRLDDHDGEGRQLSGPAQFRLAAQSALPSDPIGDAAKS